MSDVESNGNGTTEGKENIEASGRRGPGRGSTSYDGPFDKKVAEYVSNLRKERDSLDEESYPLIHQLVENELSSISKGAVRVGQENGYVDLYGEAPITLYVKAMPPSKIFPKVNYAGRMIGPKGAYLKALMKETMTKMTLLGKGVMKDKNKEDELRRGSDPKYYHLQEDMHMAILVTAPAPEAYARIAYALKCLREQALSDNQGLEELHWIANLTRKRGDTLALAPQPFSFSSAGGGEIRPARPSPPLPSQQPLGASYPPRRTPYDSPREPLAQGQLQLQTPYFSGPSYVVARRPAPQSESSRAMDYVSKVLHFHPQSSYDGRGNSPGTRPAYEYGHSTGGGTGGGMILYGQERPQHYYHTGDVPSGGSWSSSADPFAMKPTKERVERSSLSSTSQSQRYAPY